jgi:hypothetical protein
MISKNRKRLIFYICATIVAAGLIYEGKRKMDNYQSFIRETAAKRKAVDKKPEEEQQKQGVTEDQSNAKK